MLAWLGIGFGTSKNCSVLSNGVGQNRETDEEYVEDCVEVGFPLARVKYFDKDGKWGRSAVGMRYCSINTWNGLELKLTWSMKISSCFEKKFPIFLLYGKSNTWVFKVCDVLH